MSWRRGNRAPEPRVRRGARLALTLLLACVPGAGLALGAVATPPSQRVSPQEYPKLRERDLPERYRVWIEQEVVWIITEAERDVFLRLDSDDKRERFIEAFWEHRDPTPGTPRNEYIPIHYERLAYANHEFGRVAPGPGWRTDMGRIYILLGEPQSRVRLHNQSAVFPVEVWFYQMDPRLGVPTFFYVVFFRKQGMGEFKLYSPVSDGPARLLNASGAEMVSRERGSRRRQDLGMGGLVGAGRETYDALRLINPDLADAAFSLIPGEAFLGSPLRSETVIADILAIPDRMVPSIEWAYPILTGAAETEVRFDTLNIEAQAVGWLDPQGRPFVSYVMRAPGRGLNLGENEGKHYMTFSVAAYLLDSSRRVLESSPPRLVESGLGSDQLARVRAGSLMFIDRMPAVSGELELELMLENNVSHEYGEVGASVLVPAPEPDVVTLGQPVLCVGARSLGAAYDPFTAHLPFQVGGLAMTPTIDGPFAAGGKLYVFQQVLVPRSLTDPVGVTYSLANSQDAVVIRQQVMVLPSEADRFGVVNQLTGLALDVAPGSYTLRVALDGREASATLPVTVRNTVTRPIVHAAAVPPATDPGAQVRRAAVLRAAGDIDAAIALVNEVLARAPELHEGQQLQVELLRDAGRHQELETLLAKRLVDNPHDIELLVQLAEAKARQGKHYDAIRFYERAVLERSGRPELLNALAAEYLAPEGVAADRLDRAIELLQRSLEIDPTQSGVRTTLERARAARLAGRG